MSIDSTEQYKIKNFIESEKINIDWENDSYKMILHKICLYTTRNKNTIKQNKIVQKVITHAESVRELAFKIANENEEILNTVNIKTLDISALFHDLGKTLEFVLDKYDNDKHAEYSEYMTKIILKKQNKLCDDEIAEICKSIKYHSFKGELCPKDASINDKILMDADLLDEKCGTRFFELCMIQYSDDILIKNIKYRVKQKEEKIGHKLSTKQFMKIVEKCRRDNLNNENFSELFDTMIINKNSNTRKIKEKSVCIDITFPVYSKELAVSDSQFSFIGIYEFTDRYLNKLNEEFLK